MVFDKINQPKQLKPINHKGSNDAKVGISQQQSR